MATAPKVQTIQESIGDLNPAYEGSRNVINQQIGNLGQKYDAQRAGIYAARGNAYNAINNQATGRGLAFSGIPAHEQARYEAEKTLPALMQADFQQNDEGLQLQGRLADLDKELRTNALGRVDRQQSDLNNWNQMIAGQEFTAGENEKNRNFQRSEREATQAFTASQNALNRAQQAALSAARYSGGGGGGIRSGYARAFGGGGGNKAMSPNAAAQSIIAGAIQANRPISPAVFQLARDAYRSAGGNAGQFASDFWKYVPQNQRGGNAWKQYYYG